MRWLRAATLILLLVVTGYSVWSMHERNEQLRHLVEKMK